MPTGAAKLGARPAAAFVFAATALAHARSLAGGFIWNDRDYVTAPALRSWAGLGRIWTEVGATQQYYPLLHSLFWAQHRLWGDRPLGYHLVAVLLHAGAAVLFGYVLRELFRDRLPARFDGAEWLAALLFGLHPVHVESVAWISEQKNTWSLAFYLAAARAYLAFDRSRRPGAYALASALFVLSLLCKTVTATLPAALLVALWWRRGRLDWRRDGGPLGAWLLAGAAAGRFSSGVERLYGGAVGPDFDLSPLARMLVAGRAFWFYLLNLIAPFRLDFIYPRWVVDPSAWWQWLFPLAAAALAVVLWAVRRRSRAPLAACLFFAGSLVPVLGFVNLYGARYSWVWDHWQYQADLGPIALVAGAVVGCWSPRAARLGGRPAAAAAVLLATVGLGTLAWRHTGMFHDDWTLYAENLRLNPASWMAHNNRGLLLEAQPGHADEAMAEYRAALALKPDFQEAHNNLGHSLEQRGQLTAAAQEYEAAVRIRPNFADAYYNLGNAEAEQGHWAAALAAYRRAVQVRPGSADFHYNLANALVATGDPAAAEAEYRTVLALDPGHAGAHNNLGRLLYRQPGHRAEAIEQYRQALRLADSPEAHTNLGQALADDPATAAAAAAEFQAAIAQRPAYPDAHYYLASLLARQGDLPGAQAELERTLALNPNLAEAHNNLAILLARQGRFRPALAELEAALRLNPGFAPAYFARAAVLAQLGDRDGAAATLHQLLQLEPGNPQALRLLQQLGP